MSPSRQIANPHLRVSPTPDPEVEGRRVFECLKEEAVTRRLGSPEACVRDRVASEEHLESLSAADLRSLLRGFKAAVREDIEGRVTW